MKKQHISIILHNIRSAYNVGAILRTAAAAGVARIYLTGYTPTPLDRFGRPRSDIAKVALGAEGMVSWEYRVSFSALCKALKRRDTQIIGVEQDTRAQDYREVDLSQCDKVAFVFGSEPRGLSTPARNSCDMLVEIPLPGPKESLNVTVAAGIILFSCIANNAE